MKKNQPAGRPKKNERNYYRVLFVQPDAPMEIIQASYRTIMQKLRAHPDLGGDTWNASAINEAYQTLIDPLKRVQYDKKLFAEKDLQRLGLQSRAQRYQETQQATEPVDFTATWQEFRPAPFNNGHPRWSIDKRHPDRGDRRMPGVRGQVFQFIRTLATRFQRVLKTGRASIDRDLFQLDLTRRGNRLCF